MGLFVIPKAYPAKQESIVRFSTTCPELSVVIPVYNTGPCLIEAVHSILVQQSPRDQRLPTVEIVIVDDRSDDPETLSILAELKYRHGDAVRVICNERRKGAAGARNTGILASRGQWIGFLDSDDLWLPGSLAGRWRVVEDYPEAKWIAAAFQLAHWGHPPLTSPLAQRSPYLAGILGERFDAGRVTRLERPVGHFLRGCLTQVLTCLFRVEVLIDAGLFDEALRRAEDYLLFLRCALATDLYFAPVDAGVYQLRPGSLTHSNEPVFACEDVMLHILRLDKRFCPWETEIRSRMLMVLDDHCYFFRKNERPVEARRWAMKLINEAPLRGRTWKQALGALLTRAQSAA